MIDARTQQADALIGELQREHGGRLTVFLGAAPGVGKTYAMLSRARERLRQGMDVVAGVVETHGRSETAALLDGLPLLPRTRINYQGRELEELDLDALLARKPKLALIDEPGPSQRAGQPARAALAGHRRTARCRYRCLHHGQHPAPGKPQRHRAAHHRRARVRNRARCGVRPPARHRAGGPAAARTDRAPAAGQGVSARAGDAGLAGVLFAFQPHRAARVGDADRGRPRRQRPARHPGRTRFAGDCRLASPRGGGHRWAWQLGLSGAGGAAVVRTTRCAVDGGHRADAHRGRRRLAAGDRPRVRTDTSPGRRYRAAARRQRRRGVAGFRRAKRRVHAGAGAHARTPAGAHVQPHVDPATAAAWRALRTGHRQAPRTRARAHASVGAIRASGCSVTTWPSRRSPPLPRSRWRG